MRTKSFPPYLLGLFSLALLAGCGRTVAPPPLIASPILSPDSGTSRPAVASLTAEPSSVERGASVTLKWSTAGAVSTELNEGIGAVQVTGSREVFPTRDTEYVLLAKNPAGELTTARALVTVRSPAPVDLPPGDGLSARDRQTRIQQLRDELRDAYFDYDSSSIRPDAEAALRHDAGVLRTLFAEFPEETVLIEGHCDERGTSEYNLALGDQRAASSREFLITLGAPAARLRQVSMGEEVPQCRESNERCYQANRRAHVRLRR